MKTRSRVCAKAALAAIILSALATSGCAVSMLGGAARSSGAGASSGTGQATSASKPSATSDASISAAVRSRLAASASLRGFKILVDTHDGVVTLRGQVNTVEQRRAAQLEARAVNGVKAVKSELSVKQ
jgi:hyperosmotically inducible periplasmic protein